jgi:putative transposase
MSSHVFHEIYLHLNWHVKDDRPTLSGEIETLTHRLITERCRRTKGVFLHGLNGTETHLHMAVNIEPHVTISEMVQELKGGTSHDLNEQLRDKVLYWQRGYGVVSFGRKNLPWVLEYVAKQKEHHARGGAVERLERITAWEEGGEEDA